MSAKVLTMLPPPANSTYPTNPSSSSFFDMQESSHNPFNLSSASSTANSTTLFIGNLSLYCTEREIFQAFLPFGPIDSIHLKRFNDSKKISYGFVKFQERQAAEEALKTLNDQILLGRPMRLGWANELTSQGIVADFGSLRVTPPPSAQVHVTFTAMSATPVTESLLREAFEKQGAEVRDVTIKKLQYNRFTNQQTGYGFVHFPLTQQGILSAMRAVEAVNGSVVGNVALQCQLSHGLLSLLHQHQRPSSPPQPLVRHSPPQQFLPSPPSATPSPTLLNHRNTQPQSLASPPHSSQSFRLDLSSSSSDSYHRAARFQQTSGRSQHGPYSSPTTAIASSSSSSLSGHYFQPQQQSHLFETQALPSLLSSRSSSSSSENFQFPFLN